MRKTLVSTLSGGLLLSAALGVVVCSGDPATMMMPPGPVLKGPSKSSSIAISDDDSTIAVVNAEDGSVSFFSTSNNNKLSTVATGQAPSAVVIGPDMTTAYVANRGAATVVKITGINTGTPTVAAPVNVGSEPTGLALSPSGAKLYVAEFGESSVGVIDTAAMTRATFVSGVRNPKAVAVTNNLDANDGDETVIVPEFYGDPQPDGEAKNDGRHGIIHLYGAADGSDQGTIQLSPFANTDATFDTMTAPNQLGAVAISGTRIFVPSVSASPAGVPSSSKNVYPVVYVADLTSKTQVVGGSGTINLAEPINQLAAPRWFLADLNDIAFVPASNIAYAVARGADVVQRIDFGASPPSIGSAQNKQIDVSGTGTTTCQNPTGLVIASSLNRAYVNCWVTRRVAVLDLTSQTVSTVVDSVSPAGLNSAVDRGRRFYFTGRGRWSGNATGAAPNQDTTENGSAWSSCGTCHPDGLTDNITWTFASGPRQTTSMDGTFSHSPGGGAQKQRILNWSAINDELHDFEGNTRGISGGKGAITTSASCPYPAGTMATLGTETRSALPAAGLGVGGASNQTAKEIQDNQAMNCAKDFDDINEFVKTIRPVKGRRFLDQASVARGANLFSGTQGGCAKCHGGTGWTISNRFYTPSATNNGAGATGLAGTTFTAPAQYMTFASPNGNQIAAQAMSADASVAAAIPPLQLTCALRNVSTFGVPADTTRTDALEVRAGTFVVGAGPGTSNRAQGKGGYNVPALYGLQTGGPYLHHGQAKTLDDLFTDTKWQTHWQAGSANFLSTGNPAQDRTDLINFLLSIDNTTTEQAVPAGFNSGCSCPLGAPSC